MIRFVSSRISPAYCILDHTAERGSTTYPYIRDHTVWHLLQYRPSISTQNISQNGLFRAPIYSFLGRAVSYIQLINLIAFLQFLIGNSQNTFYNTVVFILIIFKTLFERVTHEFKK